MFDISSIQHSSVTGDSDQEDQVNSLTDVEENFPTQVAHQHTERIQESNSLVFTPQMIVPVPYDPVNFAPICIDDVSVSASLIQLASLSPSFSPTPSKFQPPDGHFLHEDLMEFHRVLSWRYDFRKKEFNNAQSIEEFVNDTLSTFKKSPWYKKSQNKPPPLPPILQKAFDKIYSTIMDPQNWFKYQPNLTQELLSPIRGK